MEWTERHDVVLAREILVSEPFRYKKGSVDKGKAWSTIADILNGSIDLKFKVSQRSVRERFALIQEKYKKKNSQDERSSGTSTVVTELDQLIEEITEKEKATEERGWDDNRGKIDADRAKAEEARKRAMERMGQTRRRVNEEESSNKRRKSGNDTIAFLRERSQNDRELREKELELKRLEVEEQARREQQSQQQMVEMMRMMQQQQAQMQATQAALLQQQQQQGQALLALIGKLMNEM